MRGRPRKGLEGESERIAVQRAKGREAQRRFRSRTVQSVFDLKERLTVTDHIVEQMTKSFLQLAEDSLAAGKQAGDLKLIESIKASGNEFLILAEKAHDVLMHESRGQSERKEANYAKGNMNAGLQMASRPPYEASTRIFAHQHSSSASLAASSISQIQNLRLINPSQPAESIPNEVVLMPTLRPLLVADYVDSDGGQAFHQSFWKRLVLDTLMKSAQDLSKVERASSVSKPESKSWLARSHGFSLNHASILSLLLLTNVALSGLIHENRRTQPSNHRDFNKSATIESDHPVLDYFDGPEFRTLGVRVKHDMIASGIFLEDMLDAAGVESYLEAKGMVQQSEEVLHFKISIATNQTKLVIVDVPRLVGQLVDAAVCLGDGVAFPKSALNSAIASSTIKMSDF